jgi:hypothetical protein
MSKNFSHPTAADFCFRVMKTEDRILYANYELVNIKNNQVEGLGNLQTNDSVDRFDWIEFNLGYFQAGIYQLTLRNISMGLAIVELCPGTLTFLSNPIRIF